MGRLPKPKFLDFFSPAGAGIILICFFLPWLKVSCGTKDVTLSGSGIGGIFWIIFGLALVALAAFVMLRGRLRPMWLRSILVSCSLVSAAIILYKYIVVINDPDIPFYVPSKMISFEFRPGAVGLIIGLLMVAFGAPLIESGTRKNPTSKTPPSRYVDDK